jgi:Chaperone of endosialidase
MKTTTSATTNSMNLSPVRFAFLLIPLLLTYFALSPRAQAVCQEGCLTNENTALGDDVLFSLTSGSGNTALGFNALFSNTSGSNNTSTGVASLYSNTSGSFNTSTGIESLYSNTIGSSNTATGFQALYLNNGGTNTATGIFAMYNNTTGGDNCALGGRALNNNTTGNGNTAVGTLALVNNTVGDNNIALGHFAGSQIRTGSDNIEIGNRGLAADSGTIRIGRQGAQTATFIAGISGATVPTGVAVIVDGSGHLGTTTSSARFKEAIQPMDNTSEAILALQPVTFRYKQELDPEAIPQFGLVAEEVEKVNPDLVARDEQGKPYTVRYEAVNAMLLNEFIKEHQKVQRLEAALAAVNERLKAQDAKIDKVNAKVELTKPAPQLVVKDQ